MNYRFPIFGDVTNLAAGIYKQHYNPSLVC
ncbi:BnaC04g02400D [Brassica napus]|uniref:BnaC04g02400D protein n=1 Tax=Brassica napus TaxID=3708 RepID=A0A078INJ8_BRANA|nr:BnaC04g02400D [Brassica napus]